jgi:hypothetical protein
VMALRQVLSDAGLQMPCVWMNAAVGPRNQTGGGGQLLVVMHL